MAYIDPPTEPLVRVSARSVNDGFDARWSEWRRRADAQDVLWRGRAIGVATIVSVALTGWLALAFYLG